MNSTLRLGVLLALGVSLMLSILALVSNQPVTDNSGGFFLIGAASSPLLLLGLLGLRERVRKPDTLPATHFDTAALLAVFEALPEGVVYSVNGAIRYANPALYQLFEQPGSQQRDLKTIQRLLRVILAQPGTVEGEYRLQRVDGSEFDASLTTARVSG